MPTFRDWDGLNAGGLKRNAHEENVMEHSWEVAVIVHILSFIKNRYFEGQVDANAEQRWDK